MPPIQREDSVCVCERCRYFTAENFSTFTPDHYPKVKSKVVPYLITSIWHGANSSFLAVSPQVTLVISPMVVCCYVPPGPGLFSQPNRSHPLASTKLSLSEHYLSLQKSFI